MGSEEGTRTASTLKEVAQNAGVSIAAVSKVLHGRGKSVRVSKEKAEAIRKVAAELRYYPNALARSLRSGRTQSVGLIFENFGSISAGPLYYVYLLDGVAEELFKNHYRLTILPELKDGDVNATLADGQLDGVIWCKLPPAGEKFLQAHRTAVPLVALNAPAPANPADTPFVSCDNEGGVLLALRHLQDLGHQKILFVMEELEQQTPDAVARRQGFIEGCRALGLPNSEEDVVTWKTECPLFADWFRQAPPHTAIICWNERMGAEVLARAAEAGIQVPRDLSVIGFDSTRYCETTSPRLSAVRQPIQQMARYATRLLLDMIEGVRPDGTTFTFPCSLDVRDSTSTPRSHPSHHQPPEVSQ